MNANSRLGSVDCACNASGLASSAIALAAYKSVGFILMLLVWKSPKCVQKNGCGSRIFAHGRGDSRLLHLGDLQQRSGEASVPGAWRVSACDTRNDRDLVILVTACLASNKVAAELQDTTRAFLA
jgi:hypothetical protein